MTLQTNQSFDLSQRALILGLGETGEASALWLARHGKPLRLVDTRSTVSNQARLNDQLGHADVDWVLGARELPTSLLEQVDCIVLSPGLSPHHEPVVAFLTAAQAQGIEVIGEIELFARALNALSALGTYQPRVLGITGTNGKTTVTALTRFMLEAAGMSATAAGNISPSALTALMNALDQAQLPQVWVLELSSFQLHTTQSLRYDASVVLNLSQDHLDWHQDMQEYAADKARILSHSTIQIVNRDDPAVMHMVNSLEPMNVRSFGLDVPLLAHDIGLTLEQGMRWLVVAEPTDFEDGPIPSSRRKKGAPEPKRQAGRVKQMMPADAIQLVGLHNVLNVQAALLLCRSVGAGWAPLLRSATQYVGEPHRMRFVRTVREVDFYNDSKGTNVGATVAGIAGLDRSIVLIAGGLAKGQDLTPLIPVISKHVRALVLIGQDAPLFVQLVEQINRSQGTSIVHSLAHDMNSAVTHAFELANGGEAVVLSPACASMDMFKNYGHRGQMFIDSVNELALSLGEVV